MKYIPMTSNDEYITVVLQGKPYMMATTNPNFEKVLEAWKQSSEPPEPYQAGTWGPVDSIGLLARENRSWYESKTVKKK